MKVQFSIFLLFLLLMGCSPARKMAGKTDTAALDAMIAQMIMVGFREATVDENSPILHDIEAGYVGNVILFSKDQPSGFKKSRNINSPEQVASLCRDLQKAGKGNLLIAIDEEGGRVSRLNSAAGYVNVDSAANIGAINQENTTRAWAHTTAQKVKSSGLNTNLAPVVDLFIEKKSGAIGKLKRSFSDDPEIVAKNAALFIDEHRKLKLLTAIKHFPGHGSAQGDTHDGFVDITKVWTPRELEPYRLLFQQKAVDMVMTAHVFNRSLDSIYPSTLSRQIITGTLRGQLGWQGVVISDDMHMGAIMKNYPFETAIELAINAGVDILIYSNNMETVKDEKGNTILNKAGVPMYDLYDSAIGQKVFWTIKKLVKDGKISENRIRESYNRISALKKQLQ